MRVDVGRHQPNDAWLAEPEAACHELSADAAEHCLAERAGRGSHAAATNRHIRGRVCVHALLPQTCAGWARDLADPARAWTYVVVVSASFVGRLGERELLEALCRQAFQERLPESRHGDRGDPGIPGKSRLLAEVCGRVDIDDRIAIVGYELEHRVELAATRELLCQLGGVPGETVEALVFGASDGRASTEPIRLFEAAHKAMGTLGQMLIVVDDLHWVDDMSVALLHYLLHAEHESRQPVALLISLPPFPSGNDSGRFPLFRPRCIPRPDGPAGVPRPASLVFGWLARWRRDSTR